MLTVGGEHPCSGLLPVLSCGLRDPTDAPGRD